MGKRVSWLNLFYLQAGGNGNPVGLPQSGFQSKPLQRVKANATILLIASKGDEYGEKQDSCDL